MSWLNHYFAVQITVKKICNCNGIQDENKYRVYDLSKFMSLFAMFSERNILNIRKYDKKAAKRNAMSTCWAKISHMLIFIYTLIVFNIWNIIILPRWNARMKNHARVNAIVIKHTPIDLDTVNQFKDNCLHDYSLWTLRLSLNHITSMEVALSCKIKN